MRKRTLKRLTPEAREVARLANEAASLARRLKNLALRMNDQRVESNTPGIRHSIIKKGCMVVGCENKPLPGRVFCPEHK